MDLKQLKTFVVLSKNKNYTRIADELGYAQSSISAQIQQLEQELSTKLLDRIGKKVFLTESGEQLLPYAIEMLALASTIRDKLVSGRLNKASEKSLAEVVDKRPYQLIV